MSMISTLAVFLAATVGQTEPMNYIRQVKPILAKRCYVCHGALKQSGGLRLDTGKALLLGGESGPTVVPKDSDASLLVSVITGSAGFRMPPEKEGAPLTAEEIAIVKQWIAEGATSPEQEAPQTDPRTFWSYQPVQRPRIPLAGVEPGWSRSPIDTFLAARHLEHGLTPRPDAPREVLLRRLYLDLVGVPPTQEELHEFLNSDRPDALHRVVDQLLASPLYGQRWGRHWMDVWRYSDWYGSRAINEVRYSQRHIWRWRDWIVDSLNADHGYDQMVMEMLAGDEVAPGDPQVIRATGFLGRNWYKFDRNVWMFETVEQSCQAFLGLTMRCARCHDHKFDPILQKDYYRMRAFFEPHDVRTDPVSATLATEKDATLGQVLKDGVAYVYDKQLDAPTYLFARGDSRAPRTEEPLQPGVPAALGGQEVAIRPVSLPREVIAPYLREDVVAGMVKQGEESINAAERKVDEVLTAVQRAEQRLAELETNKKVEPPPSFPIVFADRFEKPRPDVWRSVGGDWIYEAGHLTQKQPSSFPAMLANVIHPRDFVARIRYKTLDIGEIHSVGLFFDVTDLRDAQAVYTATKNATGSLQAFHRSQGTEHYPAAGIFPCPLQLNQEVTLDLVVRAQQLNVWLNGELQLAYTMPMPRRDGSFALWTHSGGAEFYELRFHPLPAEYQLANSVSEKIDSPLVAPTLGTVERAVQRAKSALPGVELQREIAQSELLALVKRVAADRAKVGNAANVQDLARDACRAERTVATAKAKLAVVEAERAVLTAKAAAAADTEAHQKAVAAAEQKLTAARKGLETALAHQAKDDATYTSLGATYPATSTGRRLALARWIADPTNPRTARVAVNHIWLRHFGEALVPTVANFGLNGRTPTHPELLDWLASELVAGGWNMKRFHRELVTSAAYQMASTEGPADSENLTRDPGNRWVWRMNSRRAESEVIRDSVLHVAGELDLTGGGPEIPESQGLESHRRSLYFRSTPNEKMTFLELFDQANPNECYRRQESVVPQQSLALFNSSLSLTMARKLASQIAQADPVTGPQANLDRFIQMAYERILTRSPQPAELEACRRFLERHAKLIETGPQGVFPVANTNVGPAAKQPMERAAENLVHVLLNHNDFVTVR